MSKLNLVAQLARRQRAVSQFGFATLVLLASAALAMLADAHWNLSTSTRVGLLTVWVILAFLLLSRVISALLIRPKPLELAGLVEREYPELNERLSTAVSLDAHSDVANGSPALVSLLRRETEIRTRPLDFTAAVPMSGAYALLGGATLALLAPVASGLVWPHRTSELATRFFLPTYMPHFDPGYRLIVRPGDLVVARGQTSTLTAVVEATREGVELPERVSLIRRDLAGRIDVLGMQKADRTPHVFFVTLPEVNSDFDYRIEAGPFTSTEFRVKTIDAVAFADGFPIVTNTPPAYAGRPTQSVGLGDLLTVQFGQLRYKLQFTRPALSATAEWVSGETKFAVPIALAAGGLTGQFEFPLTSDGTLHIVALAEHDIPSQIPPQTVRVQVDQPPTFLEVIGLPVGGRSIQPATALNIRANVSDDFAVQDCLIEWRVNGGPPQSCPLVMERLSEKIVQARLTLFAPGQIGDVLEVRLRAIDNRFVINPKLGPQTTYYPSAEQWATFAVRAGSTPLSEQEAKSRHDETRRQLESARAELTKQHLDLQAFHEETNNNTTLSGIQSEELAQIRERSQKTADNLRQLAETIRNSLKMQRLAETLRDVADAEIRSAVRDMQAAESAAADERAKQLYSAGRQLQSAAERLKTISAENDRIERSFADSNRLEELAKKQEQLRDELVKHTKKSAQQAQEELRAQIDELLKKNPELADAVRNKDLTRVHELAQVLNRIAAEQRAFSDELRKQDEQTQQSVLSELAKKQAELLERLKKLRQATQTASRAAQGTPLNIEPASQAAEALKAGKPDEALREQDRAARELERLGDELDRAEVLNRDPRETARQLAHLQAELRNQPLQTAQDRQAALAMQQAIARGIKALSVPAGDLAAAQLRKQAAEQADIAVQALQNEQSGAEAMAKTQAALEELSGKLPTLASRQATARQAIAKLRQQQEALGRQQNLALALREQAALAEQLERTDAPGQEVRLAKARAAARQAQSDLAGQRTADISASQSRAKRELERLEQALNNQKPADDRAAELARQQRELATALDTLARTSPDNWARKNELIRRQQEIADATKQILAPEAPQRLSEAVEAVQQAANFVPNRPLTEGAKVANKAAEALSRLAEQLANRESEADRADRLARRLAETAAQALRRAQQPFDPSFSIGVFRRLEQVADELAQLRAGSVAAVAKEKCHLQLTKLRQATVPSKLPTQIWQAADALRDLADTLAGRESVGLRVKQLAREQAQQTSLKAPSADMQADLARRTMRLFVGRSEDRLAQAAAASNKAAWEALESLPATALPALMQASKTLADWAKTFPDEPELQPPVNEPSPNPSPEELAQRQDALAEKTAKAPPEARSALARSQRELGQQASQLAGNSKALDEVLEAMSRAESALAGQNRDDAVAQQKAAAVALRKLKDDVACRECRGSATATREHVNETRQLAREQRDLREAVRQARDRQTTGAKPAISGNRQEQIRNQARAVADELSEITQKQPADSPLHIASSDADLALAAMATALKHEQNNQPNAANGSRLEAAAALERAAQAMTKAAGDAPRQPSPTGHALAEAQKRMAQASQKLAKDQSAGPAMSQAAESLRQASQSLQKGLPSANPGEMAPAALLGPTVPNGLGEFAGKSWGELPGEARTRILQDARAKFGEDYARIIKLYFESIADRK